MTINENLSEFMGRSVSDYDPAVGLTDAARTAYRVRVDWNQHEAGVTMTELLGKLVADPAAGGLRSLVIGAWDFEQSQDSSAIVEALVAAKDRLGGLEGLFLGDITFEEQECSWIQQSDVTPLFAAFPRLKVLRIRGSSGLMLGEVRHDALEELALESGGLPQEITASVVRADLPRLKRLELWFGDDNYGYDGSLPVLGSLLDGAAFPCLEYLGLMNAEDADEIAKAIAISRVMERIKVLDLSMGTLGDVGGSALLDGAKLGGLRTLRVDHQYMSDEILSRLKAAVPNVEGERASDADDEDRYVELSE